MKSTSTQVIEVTCQLSFWAAGEAGCKPYRPEILGGSQKHSARLLQPDKSPGDYNSFTFIANFSCDLRAIFDSSGGTTNQHKLARAPGRDFLEHHLRSRGAQQAFTNPVLRFNSNSSQSYPIKLWIWPSDHLTALSTSKRSPKLTQTSSKHGKHAPANWIFKIQQRSSHYQKPSSKSTLVSNSRSQRIGFALQYPTGGTMYPGYKDCLTLPHQTI